MFSIKKLKLDTEHEGGPDEIEKGVIPAHYSTILGLRLAKKMYSQIRNLITNFPSSKYSHITHDGAISDSKETLKRLDYLFSYAENILTNFGQGLEGYECEEVTNLGLAEEISPAYLRRRILSTDKITPRMEKILWTPYDNVSSEEIEKYHLMNRFDRYTDTGNHVQEWLVNMRQQIGIEKEKIIKKD